MSIKDKAMRVAGAAPAGRKNSLIKDGIYTLILDRAKYNDGYKGESLALEFYVETSDKKEDEVDPNVVGSKAAYVINFSKGGDYAFSNAKTVIAAILGMTDDEASDAESFAEHFEKMVSADQPFRGFRVKCDTYRTTTKDGKLFVGYNWESVEQQESDVDNAIALLGNQE